MKEKLIENGVKNLHEFGYIHCNKENILTDDVYKLFFKSMLESNLGAREDIDKIINELLLDIN